ncbi:hypothetical protein [Streptomyces cyanogenus]|uniref:Uncharacterized protein n=1 Tax=Streptomyces cyanogenus TaxID=80860 RepID=A0ABX7U6S2_STRCY|nr:hypothetical protein [Streptomyces cyanogenus]QTE03065.1 hypothetical protein S1361_37365 [Streptomyces cyanogenus]
MARDPPGRHRRAGAKGFGRAQRWAQVRRIQIRNGFLAVRAGGRRPAWTTVTSDIPNLCVFLALTEHLAD